MYVSFVIVFCVFLYSLEFCGFLFCIIRFSARRSDKFYIKIMFIYLQQKLAM